MFPPGRLLFNNMASLFKMFTSGFGLSVGKSASKELREFMDCFQPLGEKTPEGEKLRKEAFRAADPNGNGLCSLAELETWVLQVLLKKFPKTKKDGPVKFVDGYGRPIEQFWAKIDWDKVQEINEEI